MPMIIPLPSDDLPDVPESLGGTSQPLAERPSEYPGLPPSTLAALSNGPQLALEVGKAVEGPRPNHGGRPRKPEKDKFKIGLQRESENILKVLAADPGKVLRIAAADEKDALRIKMRHYRAQRQFYAAGNNSVSAVSLRTDQDASGTWRVTLYRQPEYETVLEDL